MKYFKKFNGDCGTMDNDGLVPDSIEITKVEYDAYVTAHGPTPEQIEEQRKQNIESEINKKYSIADEIDLLAEVMEGKKTKDDLEITQWRADVQAAKSKYPKAI